MKVSTRGDYAARALLSLALRGSDRPTSVKEIAERPGLPQPYLEQILLAVKGAGLVRSKRGVGGGYRIRPGYRLPPLMLTDDEAVVVALGLVAARHLGLDTASQPAGTSLPAWSETVSAPLLVM